MPEIEEITRDEAKKKGNAAFREKDYEEAEIQYTIALSDRTTADDEALLWAARIAEWATAPAGRLLDTAPVRVSRLSSSRGTVPNAEARTAAARTKSLWSIRP